MVDYNNNTGQTRQPTINLQIALPILLLIREQEGVF